MKTISAASGDEMDAVFPGDGEDAWHVWSARAGKFFGAAGEEDFESGGGGGEEHARRGVAGVFEGVNGAARSEDAGTRANLRPFAVAKKNSRVLPERETTHPRSRGSGVADLRPEV